MTAQKTSIVQKLGTDGTLSQKAVITLTTRHSVSKQLAFTAQLLVIDVFVALVTWTIRAMKSISLKIRGLIIHAFIPVQQTDVIMEIRF